ncbi:MAG: ABC transporter ATP-binding protein [Planctomycetota bacterium]|nr:ABC transporter ATP-binding protein [Planctomycetota bacterium]
MPALHVDRLSRRFGRFRAVDDVSFEVTRGSVHGLLGPNGSGKTTTLACALGLLRPHAGRASVLGEPAHRLHRTRGRVGVVFDTPILVRGLRVRSQVAYAARLYGHRGGRSVDEALELVGLADLARRPVTALSLGQQKRLALASALAGDPELLVLDEPLSGLDPLGVRGLLACVRELAARGLTIVLSSHRLHEIEPVLTHATILIGGRVARSGSLSELVGDPSRQALVGDDPARAQVLIESLGGRVTALDGRAEALLVEPGPRGVSALNRALVEAGIEVRELRPAGAGLPALFESLLDERAQGALPFTLS